ncbi:hypothetical protein A9X06_04840 [Mycobacterium sp. 852002-51759_SCH5129042]|nr:hypothetical protein A9X06_04840 [Mycobacterium sp. 852002-51759_SCH5129042]
MAPPPTSQSPRTSADKIQPTDDELRLVRALGAQHAPEDTVLRLLRAGRLGFRIGEQIRLIKRPGAGSIASDRQSSPERWITQATIDVVRHIGRACYPSQTIDLLEPVWWDPKVARWVDHWDHNAPPPSAKMSITVAHPTGHIQRSVGSANYHEHARHDDNGRPIGEWDRRPARLLADHAEFIAWSRTIPNVFAGFELLDDASIPTITGYADNETEAPRTDSTLSALRSRDTVADTTPAAVRDQASTLQQHLDTQFPDSRDAMAWVSGEAGRDVATIGDLEPTEIARILAAAQTNSAQLAAA